MDKKDLGAALKGFAYAFGHTVISAAEFERSLKKIQIERIKMEHKTIKLKVLPYKPGREKPNMTRLILPDDVEIYFSNDVGNHIVRFKNSDLVEPKREPEILKSKDIPEKFFRFLEKHDAWDNYRFMEFYPDSYGRPKWLSLNDSQFLVISADSRKDLGGFNWRTTPQGMGYWEGLNTEWFKFLAAHAYAQEPEEGRKHLSNMEKISMLSSAAHDFAQEPNKKKFNNSGLCNYFSKKFFPDVDSESQLFAELMRELLGDHYSDDSYTFANGIRQEKLWNEFGGSELLFERSEWCKKEVAKLTNEGDK